MIFWGQGGRIKKRRKESLLEKQTNLLIIKIFNDENKRTNHHKN